MRALVSAATIRPSLEGAATTRVPATLEEPPEDWAIDCDNDAVATIASRIIDARKVCFAIHEVNARRAGGDAYRATKSAGLAAVANDA